jgi:nucleoside-diphosphate-sugar epimerase
MGVSVLIDDLAGRHWHRQWSERGDYIVNCVSASSPDADGYYHAYHEGTKSIIAWTAAGGGISTMVYTGSTSVYPQTGGESVSEDQVGAIDDLTETARILLEAEELYREPLPGIERAFVMRLAGIYGPGRHYLLDQLRQGRKVFPGAGDFWLNLIHRDDAVSGILAALESSASVTERTFNLADGNPFLKRDLVAWVAKELNLQPPRWDPEMNTPRQARRSNSSGKLPHRKILIDRAQQKLNWQPQYADFRQAYKEWIG